MQIGFFLFLAIHQRVSFHNESIAMKVASCIHTNFNDIFTLILWQNALNAKPLEMVGTTFLIIANFVCKMCGHHCGHNGFSEVFKILQLE